MRHHDSVSALPPAVSGRVSRPRRYPRRVGRGSWLAGCSLGLLLAGLTVPASAADADAAAAPDETMKLSPFAVQSDSVGRYSATEAASGGRVAVNLFDSSQNISVVTRDMFDDVAATRLLDALKYSTGVTESTIPNGLDRVTIRGFQTDGSRVDNFSSIIQLNLDPVFVDRVELVKGPNAILAPSGVPGGTVNTVSRKPQFSGNAGYASVEVGTYDAQRVEFDDNLVLTSGQSIAVAARVVGAAQDTKGFAGDKMKTFALMPMVAFRTKTGAELVLQWQYNDGHVENYFGLPIDPSSGTNTTGKLLAGVNRFTNTYQADYRAEHRPEFRALLTLPIWGDLSMRLAARFADYDAVFLQTLPSTSAANYGGAVNPLNGQYYPGLTFGPAPTYTPAAAAPEPRVLARSGTISNDHYTDFDVQNDFVWNFRRSLVSLTALGGYSVTYTRDKDYGSSAASPSIVYDAVVPETSVQVANTGRYVAASTQEQFYASGTLGLFGDRIDLNASYAYDNYDLSFVDYYFNHQYATNVHAALRSVGAVVKPLPWVDFYYNYGENATPQTAQGIVQYGNKPFQYGAENEYGVRFDALAHRLYLTADYFDALQNNYSVPNPGNYVNPPPNPPLQPLFSNRRAKGWELESHWVVTDELSVVGNFTKFTNRDPNNVPFRGTAEESWGFLANYRFAKASVLHGFYASVGVDYLAKRPGDAASGVTSASTSSNVIPNQPTFYLPARTLVNFSVGYRLDRHWKAQLNVDNLFNTKYLASSINRFVVIPGAPTNVRGTFTYSF
jgi:iron complex outermembrane receptor protein